MNRNILVLLILLSIIFSCNEPKNKDFTKSNNSRLDANKTNHKVEKKKKGKAKDFQEYVYVDLTGVLHMDPKCEGIAKHKTKAPIKYIPIQKVSDEQKAIFCTRCVTQKC